MEETFALYIITSFYTLQNNSGFAAMHQKDQKKNMQDNTHHETTD